MHTVEIGGEFHDLTAIETDCWQRITSGALNHKDAFHYTTVGNVNQHGVNLRIVVLRDADGSRKELVFHTDVRSGKWKELEIDDNISFLFYHPEDKVQIRLSGKAVLYHGDPIADDAWEKCSISTRKTYMGAISPSTAAAEPNSGLPAGLEDVPPTPGQSEAGRKNFGVVVTTVNWMEWLWLNSKGHRRASFKYTDQLDFKASWLIP